MKQKVHSLWHLRKHDNFYNFCQHSALEWKHLDHKKLFFNQANTCLKLQKRALGWCSAKGVRCVWIQQTFTSSKLTLETLEKYVKHVLKAVERRHWHLSGVFIVNFEHMSQLFLMLLLFISGMYLLLLLLSIYLTLTKKFLHGSRQS